MSFTHFNSSTRSTDEGERPFWISYADLMTALMILFLVIMVSALTMISSSVQTVVELADAKDETETPTQIRADEIANICDTLAKQIPLTDSNAKIDCKSNRINFGEVGRFRTDEFKLGPQGESALANVVPLILDVANSPLGKKWLKQIVVEGFTDTDGSYLYNLNLSLKRSEWVMCSLLKSDGTLIDLSQEQRQQVKKLFLIGGVSFNNPKNSKDASRRVELRLQFYGLDNTDERNQQYEAKFQDHQDERCYI